MFTTQELINLYNIYIYERYNALKLSGKLEFDHYDLSKIFEYYTCIQLMKEQNKPFYEYHDIEPLFKEINKMSQNDTGIDCCNLEDTIVQCKLRKTSLCWNECGTFFGSQNIYDEKQNKTIVRWQQLILSRNDCHLSSHLLQRKNNKMFIDKNYTKMELINYCDHLLIHKPVFTTNKN